VTGKHIDKAKRRVNEAAGMLTGNRRLKTERRADRVEGSATNAVDKVAGALTGRKRASGRGTYARTKPTRALGGDHAHDPGRRRRNPAADRRIGYSGRGRRGV
jgi:uncharacterized protein YjbJ (UPF0337 family)